MRYVFDVFHHMLNQHVVTCCFLPHILFNSLCWQYVPQTLATFTLIRDTMYKQAGLSLPKLSNNYADALSYKNGSVH